MKKDHSSNLVSKEQHFLADIKNFVFKYDGYLKTEICRENKIHPSTNSSSFSLKMETILKWEFY